MVISVGSVYSAAYFGWYAFDGNTAGTANAWAGGSTTNWLLLELPYAIKISKVRIHDRNASSLVGAKTVILYAGQNTDGTLLGQCQFENGVSPYYKDISIAASDRVWSNKYYFRFPDYYGSGTPCVRMIDITATYMKGSMGIDNIEEVFASQYPSTYFIKY